MKKLCWSVAVLLILSAVVCVAETPTLRIGVIAPLSGPVADIGIAVQRGIEFARASYPERFADTTFIYEDSQYQPARAVAAVQKLKAIDRIDLAYVFGHGDSHAIAPVAERLGLPLVACSVERDLATGRRFVIRFFVPPVSIAQRLTRHIRESGYKNIAAVRTDNSFLDAILEGLLANLDSDIKVTTVAVQPSGDMDFRGAVSKIRGGRFDAIAVFLGQGQISQFYRQAAEVKLKLPTFGTHAFESTREVADAGGTMTGAIYAGVNASAEFRAAYLRRYGDDRQVSFAANAHDFALLSTKLSARRSKKPSAKEIISAFKGVKNFPGVSGAASYVEDPELGAGFIFPIELKRIGLQSFEVLSAKAE